MTDQLARIDWKMGQTLLPEHFTAQEDALVADAALRHSLQGRPSHGIGRLRWNDSLLAEGIISLTTLAIVLPTGQALQIPGNAKAQSFNLNVAGTTKVSVYLHLTNERAPVDANAPPAAGDNEPLERIVHLVALSAEQTQRNAVYTMKLADFDKGLEGAWSLIEDFIPPLLQVGTSPFLARTLDRLAKQLQLFKQKLQEDIAASYLGGEGLFSAKTCLKGVYVIERLFANIRGQVHPHPYVLYEALKTFYAEVCLYQDQTPEAIDAPYLHDDLSACLRKVVRPLLEQLQVSKGKTPYLAFERRDGMFQLSQIPQEVRMAKDVYFLLQKAKVSDVVSLDGVKIASRTRLPVVHQMSLVGIPVRKIDRPPFQHTFGAEVEFYQLAPGDEWDHSLREGSVTFYETPMLAKSKAFLYWRTT